MKQLNSQFSRTLPGILVVRIFILVTLVGIVFVAARNQISSSAAPPNRSALGPMLSAPDESIKAKIADRYGKLGLSFETNEGQTDQQAKFLSHGPGYDLFLTVRGAVLTLRKSQTLPLDKDPGPAKDVSSASMQQASVLRLTMIGASPRCRVDGLDELPGKVNYLIGDDPNKWHVNIPTYQRVTYHEIYPSVDMVFYGNQGELEYDFVIAPGVNPEIVRFSLAGSDRLNLDGLGDLLISVNHKELKLRKPVIYQITDQGERHEVIGRYALKGNELSFRVKEYDSTRPLIIDPVLSYSTFFGPAASSTAIAVDASGNAYLTGSATAAFFPTTAGSLKSTNTQDLPDAFVTKMNPTGTALVYSTFLGGHGQDTGNSIAVDSSGNAYITGDTTSANFPTVNSIRSSTSNFLTTLDTGAHWSGKFIGPPNGVVNVLAVDPLTPSTIYAGVGSNGGGGVYKTTDGGSNWIGLNTGLTNVNCPALVIDPTTPSTLYASLNPNNSPGSGLYKSVDGGNTWTRLTNGLSGVTVSALGIDPSSPSTIYAGASFIGVFKTTDGGASWTNSSNGISFGGAAAIAVDPANSAIVYAAEGGGGVFKTINGGANWAQVNTGLTSTTIRTLTIDAASRVYAGSVGGGVFRSLNGGGNWSPLGSLPAFTAVFSLALNANASTIFVGTATGRIYSSNDGGSTWILSYETLTRTSFNSLIINPTNSATVYAGAAIQQDASLNDHEAFVSKLNSNGSELIYSTYLGGSGDDIGRGVAVDSAGSAFVTGQTSSATFPLAAALQPSLKGTDAFVTRLSPAGDALVYSTFLGGDGFEAGNGIATDGAGSAYVTGNTGSTNFPLKNAFQSISGDGSDAFATKIDSNGTLAYSTYLGGNGTDVGNGIAVDLSGNAYITGLTTSTNYPTANAIQSTNAGSAGDVFVTKLNSLGSALVYSTYLGGFNVDSGRGIAVDSTGSAYVTGFTASPDFPVVVGALRTKSPLFKTTNGGGNWSNDNYGLRTDIVSALALDPTKPTTIYAGTRSGVYKSTDGGNNWNPINAALVRPSVVAVVVDPVTPTTVYLGARFTDFSASAGVFKSTDGGSTWNPANNGLGNGGITSLTIDPVTPATLYAGWGGGIFKSTNSGGTWTSIPQAPNSIVGIAIDPLTHATLYAADNASGGGVYKSIDSGATWQLVNNGMTNASVNCVAVDPVTPATVYAGSNLGLFKSTNAGSSWTAINGGLSWSPRVVAVDPQTPSTIYVGALSSLSAAGLFKSENGGNSWFPIGTGLGSGFVATVVVNPAKPSTVYAGSSSAGDDDAFVTKINPAGSVLVYSTLLGGNPAPGDSLNLNDEGYGIALDQTGNAYVTGNTRSPDFPTTPDSWLPVPAGGSFITKLTASYVISGQVLDGSNAPVSDAEVVLSDGGSLSTFVTDVDGSYQFSHLREGGSFTVSASKPHFTMAPPSQSFNNLTSNQTLNFIATATGAPFYSVSGTVTNNGVALSGVLVTLSGSQSASRTTDSSGSYSFTLAGGGNYTVTPSIVGFSFSPASLTFNSLSADQASANFTSARQNFVVTNTNDHGVGSLRQAILDANATVGKDTIVFNIPASGAQTINLQIALPDLADPVVIDATTQPGYGGVPLIELNGALAGGNMTSGFMIKAGGSTVRGLVIDRFSGPGIWLYFCDNNTIQGNYIGLDGTGTFVRGNNYGILFSASSNNLIGGTTAAERNIISNNSLDGVAVNGTNNVIEGNFIGTDVSGTAASPNGINGVSVSGSPAFANNLIGGTATGAGNLISGNPTGVSVSTPGNSVQGNLIGTDITGTKSVGNNSGVSATGANSLIGGLTPAARNIISGNKGDGVSLGGNGTRLQGNFIGTDITGTLALGNGGSGVTAGNGALIGGTTPEARNIISGNGGFGNISLGSNSSGSAAVVQGNYIGTDVTGNLALSNPLSGISISGANNLIGGLVPGAQNVISGNQMGIQIGGSISSPPTGNMVQGNIIGLNALGTAPLPNSRGGINFSNASNNSVGGTQAEAANRINFNGGPGVSVSSGTGNSIRGNSIFSNIGLGIDLGTSGITPNDSGDMDTGGNNLQNFPLLSAITANGGTTTIQGTLTSSPNTTFAIDFYSNAACDSSGNGEGAQFFDRTTATTDGNGNATINLTSPVVLASGRVITATATDPLGNTSEFSPCSAGASSGSVQFSAASYTVLEDVGNATITVVRTGGGQGTLSVNYSTADGTASAGTDYTAVSGTLVFVDGETSKTFTVPITNDGVAEPNETVRLTLSGSDIETIGSPGTATLTIQDNSTLLSLTANSIDVTEGNGGFTNAVLTVSLSAATGRTVTVDFNTIGGAATSGIDFTAVSGTLTFAPGVTAQTITVPIVGDTLNEANETFTVALSNPTNAVIGFSASVRIINDDPLPSIAVNDVSLNEGTSGTVNATFTVTLTPASGRIVFVSFNTANGTATAGSDYVATSGLLTFNPGETAKTITVPVTGDTVVEPDETFLVNLTNAVNATISRSQGVGTILDDDTLRLILDESGPDANQAAAFDSFLFLRDPFHVQNIVNWIDLGPDPNTRVILFAANLQLNQGETASAVVVNLVDANNQSFDVPAEDVRVVPGFAFTQVKFRLPDNLAAGVCMVTIKAHGQISNTGTMRIVLP